MKFREVKKGQHLRFDIARFMEGVGPRKVLGLRVADRTESGDLVEEVGPLCDTCGYCGEPGVVNVMVGKGLIVHVCDDEDVEVLE